MGDGMPYHLEKGALLRIFEKYLNGDRAMLEATLETLQESERHDDLKWITDTPLWTDSSFVPQWPGEVMRGRLLTEWFGYVPDGAGGWSRPQPPPPTTGYWIGYRGDVATIVRRALIWALQLALGTGSDTPALHPNPWPIELFWKCPAPWFEAWVVSRRVPTTDAGLVTVVLVSPSHKGATVARSPLATSEVASPQGSKHPVPSTQYDYEEVSFPRPLPALFPITAKVGHQPGSPRVPARERNFATWVVTHAQHVLNEADEDRRGRQKFTALPLAFPPSAERRESPSGEIPQLAEYEGSGDVVIVAPSMAAGGIHHDGKV